METNYFNTKRFIFEFHFWLYFLFQVNFLITTAHMLVDKFCCLKWHQNAANIKEHRKNSFCSFLLLPWQWNSLFITTPPLYSRIRSLFDIVDVNCGVSSFRSRDKFTHYIKTKTRNGQQILTSPKKTKWKEFSNITLNISE